MSPGDICTPALSITCLALFVPNAAASALSGLCAINQKARQYNHYVRFALMLAALAAVPALNAQSQSAALLNRFCVTCHNDKLKTGGLVLNPADLARVPETAETWEKVIRKLRAGAMPPAGAPKPAPAAALALRASLETELDRAAADHPKPGKLPLLHRLSRTEYANAIRDLLGVG